MTNREIAEAFAAQFNPPLSVVGTKKINGKHVADAWLVAYYNKDTGRGITAHSFAGKLHAYLETLVPGKEAESAGHLMAKALGMSRPDGHA